MGASAGRPRESEEEEEEVDEEEEEMEEVLAGTGRHERRVWV